MSDPAGGPASTPVIEQIHRHATVRSYRPDPVPREMAKAIVLAGQPVVSLRPIARTCERCWRGKGFGLK